MAADECELVMNANGEYDQAALDRCRDIASLSFLTGDEQEQSY